MGVPKDNRFPITLASGIYDITQPLISGLIDVEGIKLNVLSDFINSMRFSGAC